MNLKMLWCKCLFAVNFNAKVNVIIKQIKTTEH